MSIQLAILVVTGGIVLSTGCHGTRTITRDLSEIRGVIAIHTAQTQYYSQFGKYAVALAELGPASADLISSELASGKKNGHIFSLRGTPNGYQITVKPDGPSKADSHTLFSDQTQIFRENYSREPATAQSKAIQ